MICSELVIVVLLMKKLLTCGDVLLTRNIRKGFGRVGLRGFICIEAVVIIAIQV